MNTVKHNLYLAVRYYSGKLPSNFEVIEDPKVQNTFAIQCRINGQTQQFLIEGYSNMKPVFRLADLLEECEFTNWPPTSR